MFLRVAIILLFITAVGLAGWRLLQTAGPAAGLPKIAITPQGSDYYMRDATIHQMDEQGQMAYRMEVDESLHYADNSARLYDIHVHYVANTPTWWDLDADKGYVPPDINAIHLKDGVKLRHPESSDRIVHIRTDNAWVYPKTNLIKSQAHIIATEPNRVTEGDGLYINMENDQLRLLDNVRTLHQTP